jgi:hypothetical protein
LVFSPEFKACFVSLSLIGSHQPLKPTVFLVALTNLTIFAVILVFSFQITHLSLLSTSTIFASLRSPFAFSLTTVEFVSF